LVCPPSQLQKEAQALSNPYEELRLSEFKSTNSKALEKPGITSCCLIERPGDGRFHANQVSLGLLSWEMSLQLQKQDKKQQKSITVTPQLAKATVISGA
jgi:hypothetical protein